MESCELKKWIKINLFKENGELNAGKIKKNGKWIEINYKNIKNDIIEFTNFLPKDSTFSRRIWHILNDIYEIPKCGYCHKEVKFIKFSKGYRKYCDQKCTNKARSLKFKEKYGVETPFQLEEFKTKASKTNLRMHGNKNYNNREGAKQTCLEKYGKKNVSQVKEIKEKKIKTNLKKYGTKFVLQNEKIKEKSLETLKNKYNIDKEIKNVFEIDEIKQKIKETNLKKYGVEHNSQKNLININDLNKTFIEENFLNENRKFNIDYFQRYFNISYSQSYKTLKSLNINYKKFSSRSEVKLHDYISSLCKNIIKNSRSIISPLELDIYLPDYNLAIEFNGLYWHNDEIIDKDYHLNKTKLCEEKNIQLIHVFEHHWNDLFKREIIKSMISSKLQLNNKIYARKCKIKEVENNVKDDFLNKNHIQGQCKSSINLGLYYNKELVSLICFSKSRFNKNFDYEMIRFCSKKYFNVIGGASKLLKHFKNNYNSSIITYADRTYSNGNLYENIGFKKHYINKPKYYYFKNGEIINRMSAQKKKLPKLINNFDPILTEYKNMKNNGFKKIWDCGTITYIL